MNSTHACMVGSVIEVLSIVCIIHMFGVKDIVLLWVVAGGGATGSSQTLTPKQFKN